MPELSASLPAPGRTANIVLWVLQVLLACAFFAAGAAKLAGVPQLVAIFEQIGIGQWFRYFTALVELAGALGLLVPRATPYAAALLALTMVCATVTHLAVIGGSPLPAIVLGAIAGYIAYRRRPRAGA